MGRASPGYALRAQCNLLNRINLMLAVQSGLQKYFYSRLTQITPISVAVLPPEGRIPIVIYAGRDAVDVSGAADESTDLRTAKSCGPDAPTLASSRWRQLRRRRWQTSPVTGDRKIPFLTRNQRPGSMTTAWGVGSSVPSVSTTHTL
jgi:hypothetical protein